MQGSGLKDVNLKFNGIYRALVVSTADTEKLGRIRARVYPMFADIAAEYLPWAVPAMSIFTGAGLDTSVTPNVSYGSFCVPDENTFVFVFFENGDPYQPVYFASAPTATYGLPASRETNYPARRVLRTLIGIEIYIDDTANELKVSHPTGTWLKIDQAGKVFVYSKDDLSIEVEGNVEATVAGDVNVDVTGNVEATVAGDVNVVAQGDINAESSTEINITAPTVNINSI